MTPNLKERAVARPAVFTEPGALLYAGNCRDLYDASLAGKVTLSAWTRRKYPGTPLGDNTSCHSCARRLRKVAIAPAR